MTIAKIIKVEVTEGRVRNKDRINSVRATALGCNVEDMWLKSTDTEGESGIAELNLATPDGVVIQGCNSDQKNLIFTAPIPGKNELQ